MSADLGPQAEVNDIRLLQASRRLIDKAQGLDEVDIIDKEGPIGSEDSDGYDVRLWCHANEGPGRKESARPRPIAGRDSSDMRAMSQLVPRADRPPS